MGYLFTSESVSEGHPDKVAHVGDARAELRKAVCTLLCAVCRRAGGWRGRAGIRADAAAGVADAAAVRRAAECLRLRVDRDRVPVCVQRLPW